MEGDHFKLGRPNKPCSLTNDLLLEDSEGMRNLQASDLCTLAAVCFLPIMLCCREHRQILRIELPHSFAGPVRISCGSYGNELQTTTVAPNGTAVAPVCVKETVDVLVVRDGKTVNVDDSLQWEKTGDGVPVSLTFSAK